jgi:hypothetical protein
MQSIGYYPMSVHWDRESGHDYRNYLHVGQYFLIRSVCKFLLYANDDNVLLTKWFIAEP